MLSFTSVLVSVVCLLYLQSTNCVAVDCHIQPRRVPEPALAKSERLAKKDSGKPSAKKKSPTSPKFVRPKREKRKSKYDLLHGMYIEYKNNWHFQSFALSDSSSTKYSEVANFFKPTIDEILAENLLPYLTSKQGRIWQSLNESLVESYENERGVIVYDQDFFRWVYCGWLIIDSDNIRMCAPLLPLGLEDIGRMPLKDYDYIPKDTAKYLYDRAASRKMPHSESKKDGKSMLAWLRKIITRLLTVRQDFLLVDLFADNADTYNENCLVDNVDNLDCSPICCYSRYIGSSFCTDPPMNCIYFSG